jgi:hypothetical protein
MQLLDYHRDEDDRITVRGMSARHYRYFDATPMVEALGRWVDRTLDEAFPDELRWLEAHDHIRTELQKIVDLPEKHARTLIQVSRNKRDRFLMLTDEEIARIEAVVQQQLVSLDRRR